MKYFFIVVRINVKHIEILLRADLFIASLFSPHQRYFSVQI